MLKIIESWKVVDRWWTQEPIEHHYAVIESEDGHRIALLFNVQTKEFSLIEGEKVTG